MKQNKILVFWDCDGTLIETTLPEPGKDLWSKYYNKPYPHKGWWGREESLDLNVFPNEPKAEVFEKYLQVKHDPNYFNFVLTSREPKLQSHLEKIFAKHDIVMERIMCKKGNYTKGQRIEHTIKEYSENHNITEVILYDDRNKEHATVEPYRSQWESLGIKVTLIKVVSDAQD
jgi:antitoxin component YwqK of YwqJK toxin-antitoxin module